MSGARFWERTGERGAVRCGLCFRGCVVPEGGTGFCGVRANRGGGLVSLVAGGVASVALDPVEKKPLHHFLPGTRTLSVGTEGCNFACRFCQNSSLSRSAAETGRVRRGEPATPERVVGAALGAGAPSVSFTYNEPTVFMELLAPTAELALERGLGTVMVTNGCMSAACLSALDGLVTAANVDLKSFSAAFYRDVCSGDLATVLRNLVRMREMGIWVEVTTLVIPGLNDSEAELRSVARFVAGELGPETPWHVSAFFPAYRMLDRPPTPPSAIRRACALGREEGLLFVYGGNVRSEGDSDTRCPSCGALCIARRGFGASGALDGACPSCGLALPGVWRL